MLKVDEKKLRQNVQNSLDAIAHQYKLAGVFGNFVILPFNKDESIRDYWGCNVFVNCEIPLGMSSKLRDRIDASIALLIEELQVCEDKGALKPFVQDGIKFQFGDGDDSLAAEAMTCNSVLRFWIRAWA